MSVFASVTLMAVILPVSLMGLKIRNSDDRAEVALLGEDTGIFQWFIHFAQRYAHNLDKWKNSKSMLKNK